MNNATKNTIRTEPMIGLLYQKHLPDSHKSASQSSSSSSKSKGEQSTTKKLKKLTSFMHFSSPRRKILIRRETLSPTDCSPKSEISHEDYFKIPDVRLNPSVERNQNNRAEGVVDKIMKYVSWGFRLLGIGVVGLFILAIAGVVSFSGIGTTVVVLGFVAFLGIVGTS